MSLEATVLTVVGSIIGAVLVFLAAVYSARSSSRVAKRSADNAERSVDVDEWRAILSELRSEVTRLGSRVDSLEKSLGLEERLRRAAISYARELLAWARVHLPSTPPPPIPEALRDELP